jgi:large subunit ribosomal protein L24
MMRVKKNDTVVIIAGKDKGKRGTLLAVDPGTGKVMVKGIALATHFVKARQGQSGGIKKEESFIDASNVMPLCASCGKATRVNSKMSDSEKLRICNRCKATL